MAGFRGIGDDAIAVAADQRRARVQMAAIAAQERASERSAAMQGASLAENARQANMANQREADRLAANSEAQSASLAAEQQARAATLAENARQFDTSTALSQQRLDLERRGQQAETNIKLMGVDQNERQLQLNEATYLQLQTDMARQQEADDEMRSQVVAAEVIVMPRSRS